MKKCLFIIDAQNDFCTENGALVCKESGEVVKNICELLRTTEFDKIICTLDTHGDDYLETIEGTHLPVKHCIKDTWGHRLNKDVYMELYNHHWWTVEKNGFMLNMHSLGKLFENEYGDYEFYVCGFATDICVLNNALMLKGAFPNMGEINLIENCCAGTTKEKHKRAVEMMKNNHINIISAKFDDLSVKMKMDGLCSDIERYADLILDNDKPYCQYFLETMLSIADRKEVWTRVKKLFKNNKGNGVFVANLCRSIAKLTDTPYDDDRRLDEEMLFPIIKHAMYGSSAEQECALAVIEEWRSKKCADLIKEAVKNASFTPWMKDYAEKVMREIYSEQKNQ